MTDCDAPAGAVSDSNEQKSSLRSASSGGRTRTITRISEFMLSPDSFPSMAAARRPLVLVSGPLVLWSSGPLVSGPLVLWSSGPLSSGPLVLWSSRPLVLWSSSSRPLVLSSSRPLVLSASCVLSSVR